MRTLTLLLLTLLPLGAQNYAVRLWSTMPTNSPEVLAGIPLSAHVNTLTTHIGTRTNVTPPWVLMNQAQFQQCIATNAAGVTLAISNLNWQAEQPQRTAIAAFRNLFDDFVAYEQFCRVSNPSAAQVGVQVRKLNGAMISLGPILRELYENRQ